jgi:beta-lactamase regulating signal transducer with metallopeptidase domain
MMMSFVTMRAALFAGECFAVSVFLPVLAWLGSRVLRQASVRHLLWLSVFGVLAVFPLAAAIVPSALVYEHQTAPRELPVPVPLETASLPAIAAEAAAEPAPMLPAFDGNDVAMALLVVWLAGAGICLARLAIGLLGLRHLKQDSLPHKLKEDFDDKVLSRCDVRLSARDDGPLTWGVLRPVILLPHDAKWWPRERLYAVLLHEVAHVRRRDCLAQLLSDLVCALYWPSTLVWIATRALRREAEIAADDAVIGSGVKPSAYAGELVQLAAEFRGRAFASSMAIALPSSLETRVKSVLAPHQKRKGATSMDAFKLACLGVTATSLLVLARPDMVLAQDQSAQPAITSVQDTPSTPPAPDAPVVSPAPDVVPVPPVSPDAPSDRHHHRHVVIHIDRDSDPAMADVTELDGKHRHAHSLITVDGDIDQARLEAAMAKAREAQAKIAELQPKIEAELAKVNAETAKAMKDAEPRIKEALARAQAKMASAAKMAEMEARINEKVAAELARVKPRIDAAMAKMHVKIMRIEKGDDVHSDTDRSDDMHSDDDTSDDTKVK